MGIELVPSGALRAAAATTACRRTYSAVAAEMPSAKKATMNEAMGIAAL
jgi:hypothetical protein